MKFKRLSFGTLGLLAVGGLAWGCSDQANDCNANKNCGDYGGGAAGTSNAGASGASGNSGHGGKGSASSSGAAGDDGDSGAAGTGGGTPICDPGANPATEPCVIGNEYGLFVSPDGDDAGDGTREAPFATVSKALDVAGAGTLKRLYVCAAPYSELGTLVIPNRVEIYGGFDCTSWAYDVNANQKAFITSSTPVAAVIDSATQAVIMQDLRIDASDAPANSPGSSSFGLIIRDSVASFRRVEIRAGKATAGKDGKSGVVGMPGADSATLQDGSAACSVTPAGGAAVAPSACGSKGGNGGTAYLALNGASGDSGVPTKNVTVPDQPNGGAGAKTVGESGQVGFDGYSGNAGNHGAVAPQIGSFTAEGFTVASGANGSDGHPGQGGGGGGASKGNGTTCTGATGAAGGMGGCGGTAGTGGTGGGASVAVLSWNTKLTLDACTLLAGAGGAGGKGAAAGAGGPGKDGGKGGMGNGSIGKGGNGGTGGYGGRGGSGSGGTGGPSAAIVYSGTAPALLNKSTLTPSQTKSAMGSGGQVNLLEADSKAPDGSVGIAVSMYTPPVAL